MDRSSITAPKPPKRNVVRIKIISMGPAASGKSCLIKRYCEEKVLISKNLIHSCFGYPVQHASFLRKITFHSFVVMPLEANQKASPVRLLLIRPVTHEFAHSLSQSTFQQLEWISVSNQWWSTTSRLGFKYKIFFARKIAESRRNDSDFDVDPQVKVNFWDLAGGQEYFEVRNEFYRDAQGVSGCENPSCVFIVSFYAFGGSYVICESMISRVLVHGTAHIAAQSLRYVHGQALLAFDVGSRAQFEQLDAWAQEAAKYGARDMSVVVCANKVGKPRPLIFFLREKHDGNMAGIAKLQKLCKKVTLSRALVYCCRRITRIERLSRRRHKRGQQRMDTCKLSEIQVHIRHMYKLRVYLCMYV